MAGMFLTAPTQAGSAYPVPKSRANRFGPGGIKPTNKEKAMNKKTVLAALATLLTTSLCTLGSAEAGMVKVINNSNFVLVVGVKFSDGSKNSSEIINPNSSKPGLGSPVKAVSQIRVVNTTDGTDPNKALLKEYQESAPKLLKDYVVTVDKQGGVTVTSSTPAGFF